MHPLEIMAKAARDHTAGKISNDEFLEALVAQAKTPEIAQIIREVVEEKLAKIDSQFQQSILDAEGIVEEPQTPSPPLNIQPLDILTVKSGVIAHQVNLKGVMGAGLAVQIRNKWPQVYQSYVRRIQDGNFHLGMIQVLPVGDGLWVANLAAQSDIGADRQQTDYGALKTAMSKLRVWADSKNLQVYLPYKIGCGLACGDWSIVSQIIHDELPSAIICKLERA